MKKYLISAGLMLNMGLFAGVWEKPKYTPDEGHLQEEMERQEERPETEKIENKKHQDQTPEADPGFEKINDEMTEAEET